jgi:hypothetical protein
MTPCSSDFVLDAAYGDALDPASQRALDEHLRECPRCARRRQLLAQQREEFLGKREFRLRRPMRERSSPLPPTRRFSLRMAALLALGVLWFAIWISAHTGST